MTAEEKDAVDLQRRNIFAIGSILDAVAKDTDDADTMMRLELIGDLITLSHDRLAALTA